MKVVDEEISIRHTIEWSASIFSMISKFQTELKTSMVLSAISNLL
jgi:hypothetical protein